MQIFRRFQKTTAFSNAKYIRQLPDIHDLPSLVIVIKPHTLTILNEYSHICKYFSYKFSLYAILLICISQLLVFFLKYIISYLPNRRVAIIMKPKYLLTGNEAVARGAYEAGVKVCSSYPGTPSTEIFENLPQYQGELYCEWAPNEKVAVEVAYGAAIAGARSLCAMKHVGVNVAADPLFTAAYNGVNRGFVIVTADDPSMHSSQNEQDNRYYAKAAKVALVEPSDSQECIDFLKEAYKISERFDMPVLFRTTTRISHSNPEVSIFT